MRNCNNMRYQVWDNIGPIACFVFLGDMLIYWSALKSKKDCKLWDNQEKIELKQ